MHRRLPHVTGLYFKAAMSILYLITYLDSTEDPQSDNLKQLIAGLYELRITKIREAWGPRANTV